MAANFANLWPRSERARSVAALDCWCKEVLGRAHRLGSTPAEVKGAATCLIDDNSFWPDVRETLNALKRQRSLRAVRDRASQTPTANAPSPDEEVLAIVSWLTRRTIAWADHPALAPQAWTFAVPSARLEMSPLSTPAQLQSIARAASDDALERVLFLLDPQGKPEGYARQLAYAGEHYQTSAGQRDPMTFDQKAAWLRGLLREREIAA